MDTSERSLPNTAVWGEQHLKLKDLVGSQQVPGVFKVVRGQYRNIGTDRGQNDVLYVHSIQTSQKILTETLKVNSNRIVRSEQRFSVPTTYQGWFELMSEDGKPINAINCAQDLSKIFRHWCLVRESFRAPISDNGVDNKMSIDQTRLIKAGERLNLQDEVITPVKTSRGNVNKRFLRCVDEQGKHVFLSFEQNTFLSPIAGSNNISGVHTLKGLLDKFRFPITVRLVHGAIPTKIEKNWSSVFRFLGTYMDETMFVLPLKSKDATMMTISTREPLQVVGTKNVEDVRSNPEMLAYFDKCNTLLNVYNNSIHVLVDLPHPRDVARSAKPSPAEHSPKAGPGEQSKAATRDPADVEDEDLLFEEIEEIYRYVRDGGDPPEPKPRTLSAAKQSQTTVIEENIDRAGNYARVQDLNKTQNVDVENVIAEDNDYWEEPIYADIAEIQERKRKSESTMLDNVKESTVTTSTNVSTLLKPESAILVYSLPANGHTKTISVIENELLTEPRLVSHKTIDLENRHLQAVIVSDERENTVKTVSPVANNSPVVLRGNGPSRLGKEVAQRMSFWEERVEKSAINPVMPKTSNKLTPAPVSSATPLTNSIGTEKLKQEVLSVINIENAQDKLSEISQQKTSKVDTASKVLRDFVQQDVVSRPLHSTLQNSDDHLKTSHLNSHLSQSNTYTPPKSPTNEIMPIKPLMEDGLNAFSSTHKVISIKASEFSIGGDVKNEIMSAAVSGNLVPGNQRDRISIETEALNLRNEMSGEMPGKVAKNVQGVGLFHEVVTGNNGIRAENGTSTLGTGLRSEIGVGSRVILSEVGQIGRTVIPVTALKSPSSIISDRPKSFNQPDLIINDEKQNIMQMEHSGKQSLMDARNSPLMDGSVGNGTTTTVIQDRTILRVNGGSQPASQFTMSSGPSRSPSFSENTLNYPTMERNDDFRRNTSYSGITTVHVANPAARTMSTGGQTFSASTSTKTVPQIVQLPNGTGSPRTNTLVRVQQSTYVPQGQVNIQSSANGIRSTPFIVNASVLGRPGGATLEYNRRY